MGHLPRLFAHPQGRSSASPRENHGAGSVEPENAVMEHLNWGDVQLGLFALAFAALQVWWIGSTLRRRDLARPLSESEFRRSLERIWSKKA